MAVRLIGNKARAAVDFFERNDMAESDNILTKLQDLLVYLIPQLNKFPRDQKFVLGDWIETKLLDVQEFCLRACYGRDKRGKGSPQGKRIQILRVTRPALINTAALARCHGWSATFLTVSNGFPSDGKPLKRLDFALRLLDTGLKPRC
jgi:hypothetical protein